MRGIAILMVLAVHLEFQGDIPGQSHFAMGVRNLLYTGWSGVDLFFVLSGFLITGILLDTKNAANRVISFYARRTLRIFPLYYAVLIAAILIVPRFPSLLPLYPTPAGWLSYLLYVQNWYMPVNEQTHMIVGQFWSLGVEEQFYLMWPWIVWRTPQKRLVWICGMGIAVAFALRCYLNVPWNSPIILMNTFTRMDTLLVGAVCAIAVRDERLLARVRRFIPFVLALAVVGMWVINYPLGEIRTRATYTQTIGFTLLALGYGAVVLLAYLQSGTGSWIDRFLSFPLLRKFGQYSYGIYIYHGFVLFAVAALMPHGLAACFAAVAGAFLVSMLSYELFEKRFLSLKSHFRAAR